MSFADYRRLPGINWSLLKHARTSALHYLHASVNTDTDTVSRMEGRALHTLVLEPEKFGDTYAVYDGGKRGTNDFKAFVADNPGRTILKANEIENVRAQAAAVRRHKVAMRVLEGQHEVAMQWTDAASGLRCKGLADSLSADYLADLKGTGSLRLFERTYYRDGYGTQICHYLDGARSLGMDPRPVLVAVETRAPFDVGVFALPDVVIAQCQRERAALLALVAECERTGIYNGYAPDIVDLTVPGWAIDDETIDIPEEGLELSDD